MKRIFRSIINIKKSGIPTIPLDELARNYKIFITSKVQPEDASFLTLYHWIEAHFRAYKELPSIELLFEKSREEGDESVQVTLKEIASQIGYTRSDFRAIVKEKHDEQSKSEFQELLTKTWQAASSSLEIGKRRKKKKIKGINQAIEYFGAEARKFRLSVSDLKTESQIRSENDSKEVREAYNKRKKDPLTNLGLFTFLDKIDESFRGTKLGNLMIIAAYVSQGKTTFAANLAYNGIMQGLNGSFIAMEMNFEEMRDLFYVLHTCNPEWLEHHKYKNLVGTISYEKVQHGELSDLEQEFFECASEDFGSREDFGKLFLYQPPEALTPSRYEMELYDRQATLAEEDKNLEFSIIDYVGLMVQDRNERYGDFNIDLNNIIKKLKNLAIQFNEGQGLRVITPFQVNREGWKDAIKNDGIYKLTALSNANESERAADQVITLFMNDEMKKSGMIKIGCLKHRNGAIFYPFEAHIDFISRKIRDFTQKRSLIDEGMDIVDIANMDEISGEIPLD